MHEGDVRDQIAQLEDRIAALAESIERCQKIALGSKISIAAGAIWLALVLSWIIAFNPTAFVAALTAVLGGIAVLGSNATTWAQAEADLHAAETMRAELIGRIDLRVVGEDARTFH